MIDKMTKYSFVLLSGDAPAFLKNLEELGVVDITRSEKPVDDVSTKLAAEADACGKAISYLKAIEPDSDPGHGKFTVSADGEIRDPLSMFQEIAPKVKQLKADIDAAHKELEEARIWGNFDKKAIEDLYQAELGVMTGKVDEDLAFNLFLANFSL